MVSGLAFLSVLAFHDTARWVGGGWMAFGLLFYVVYRKVFEGTSLTKRVSVTEQALTKKVPELAYRKILVPIFGTKLDDDIVSTAGRLAAAEQEDAGGKAGEARLDLVYVVEVPLSLPLDAPLPPDQEERARRALERAREVGDEYEDVEVQHRGDPRPQGGRRDRRGGAQGRLGSDRRRRRAAEPDQGRRDDGRDRRRQAGRDRRRDRVRADEGPLPGAAHRAAGSRPGAGARTGRSQSRRR